MSIAMHAVAAAIADGRIVYLMQPVKAIGNPRVELYRECLARMIDRHGRAQSPLSFVPQLEASGYINLLDEHMIKLALDDLALSKAGVLGCNISAETVQNPNVWRRICSKISRRPELAHRLVIEITETRPILRLQSLVEHIAEVRALGCRVAIDDFGAGFISPSLLLKLEIDIVKIDASILRTSRQRANGMSSLLNIVRFAMCSAPVVVVEGVEYDQDLELAEAAGATHAQGYLIGMPIPRQRPSCSQKTDPPKVFDLGAT